MAKKKQKNTFEENLSRLEEIGKELDEGDLGLEKSIALFEEGIQLSKLCITALQKAELKITKLKNDLSEITSGEDEEEIE
ncbi:exodeoxyribonuclease VII small subunit [bacterium BMS3Abin03]|jgi:exodeoxyribonuclease VII small subunit|nr:exodeoxyribonuclease VII small subunit [bacterium BMS3Abin03]